MMISLLESCYRRIKAELKDHLDNPVRNNADVQRRCMEVERKAQFNTEAYKSGISDIMNSRPVRSDARDRSSSHSEMYTILSMAELRRLLVLATTYHGQIHATGYELGDIQGLYTEAELEVEKEGQESVEENMEREIRAIKRVIRRRERVLAEKEAGDGNVAIGEPRV